jgi:hypothetical protein
MLPGLLQLFGLGGQLLGFDFKQEILILNKK